MKESAKNKKFLFLILMSLFACCFVGCTKTQKTASIPTAELTTEGTLISKKETSKTEKASKSIPKSEAVEFDFSSIPEYDGNPYEVINDNVPFFSEEELTTSSYEEYADLDSLGRCGVCVANIGTELMPTEERGKIGNVKPSGWNQEKYPGLIDGNYLYNRCHLIGYQLTGENDNTSNLITGTRYLNTEGMLPFENMVTDYIKETNNHVLYRVTPYFEGDNLLAKGVLMEAKSVEDDSIEFCVFCYNVQPGVIIDYSDGSNHLEDAIQSKGATTEVVTTEALTAETSSSADMVWIPTHGGKKYHSRSDCSGMKEPIQVTEEEAISRGYTPCKRCH